MRRRAIIAGLIIALFLALPLAQAEWRGRGYYEPDTAQDAAGGYMFVDPDVKPAQDHRQVYFNVAAYQDDAAGNPNSAETGSAIMPYPTRMHAFLGVWKDCNKDGYIGHPEGVLQWYPSQLLLDSSVCPVQPTPDYRQPGQGVVFNDGAWVREFFMVGPDAFGSDNPQPRDDTFRFNIADESARIWGDWGLPTDGPIPTCALTPVPDGTIQSTGGFLRYSDCHLAWQITSNINAVTGLVGMDETIGFADASKERPDESNSPLNQENPYGDPSGPAIVEAWDCGADPALTVPPLTGDASETNVYSPSPGAPNTGGSIGGTVNSTQEGVANCDREDNTQRVDANVYAAVEDDHEGVQGPRSRTDFYFDYREPVQDGCGAGYLLAAAVADTLGVFPKRPPTSCTLGGPEATGEGAHWSYVGSWTNVWFGNPGYTSSRNPYINKETLEPWGGSYATFYARVSPALFPNGLPGAQGTYGSDHCSNGAPVTGRWNCDVDAWWINPTNGENEADPDGDGHTWRASVGASYNLRDIDCWDHSPARGAPGTLSLVGSTVCARP